MSKDNKNLILMGSIILLISVSFRCGVKYGKTQTYSELFENQKITLQAQKDLTESLKNQVDYITFRNIAHEKVVDMDMARWLDEMSVEGERWMTK